MAGELVSLASGILGLGLLIFALGSICGWLWAVKSLRVRPPAWITAVTALGGMALAASFAAQGSWIAAAGLALMVSLEVGVLLRVGPFRASGDGDPS